MKASAGEDSDSGLPSSSAALTSDDDNLSSWARYLKNKYGSKTKKSSSKDEQQRNEINSKQQQQHNTVCIKFTTDKLQLILILRNISKVDLLGFQKITML